MNSFRILVVAMTVASFPAMAQADLVPSLGSGQDICSDRPSEPEWMQSIGLREAYKRVLVQDIYRARSLERIVATGSCSCETRFPTWEAAAAEFRDRFGAAERWEMLEASEDYNRNANALRSEAMEICNAEGNW